MNQIFSLENKSFTLKMYILDNGTWPIQQG